MNGIENSVRYKLKSMILDVHVIGENNYERFLEKLDVTELTYWDYLVGTYDVGEDITFRNLMALLMFDSIFIQHKKDAVMVTFIKYLTDIGALKDGDSDIIFSDIMDAEEIEKHV